MTPIEATKSFFEGFSAFSEVEPYLVLDKVCLDKCLVLIPFRLVSSVHELEEYSELDYPSDLIEQVEAEIAEYKKVLKKYDPENPLCEYSK